MKRSELKSTPEKTRAWQRRSRQRLPAQSEKRRAKRPKRDFVRAAVFERDGYTCQMRGWRGRCWGPLTYHHLKKASRGGDYTIDNGLTACLRHNDIVEDYPIEAQERGWVL